MEPGGGVDCEGFVGELTDVVLDFYRGDVVVIVVGLLVGVVGGGWYEEGVQVAEEALNSHFDCCRLIIICSLVICSFAPQMMVHFPCLIIMLPTTTTTSAHNNCLLSVHLHNIINACNETERSDTAQKNEK